MTCARSFERHMRYTLRGSNGYVELDTDELKEIDENNSEVLHKLIIQISSPSSLIMLNVNGEIFKKWFRTKNNKLMCLFVRERNLPDKPLPTKLKIFNS